MGALDKKLRDRMQLEVVDILERVGVTCVMVTHLFDRESLNAELEKIEKPAGISNPKDFRNEIVNFVLRARAHNSGRNPNWTSYEKLRTVIEKKMFSNTEELLPVISFNTKTSTDEQKKHDDFVDRMMEKGYTRKQVRLLCEWYLRVRKSS